MASKVETNTNVTIEVTEMDLVRAQHREARECVEFGMYNFINSDNFDLLTAEDLAIYQILARKKHTDKLREVRTMVVNDSDAFSRVGWQMEEQEMKCVEIVNDNLPEAGLEKSPVFLGDSPTMAELDWYIHHGLVDLINKLNVPALKTIGEEDIERLRQEAMRQDEIMRNDSMKANQFGFGVNGNSKVK